MPLPAVETAPPPSPDAGLERARALRDQGRPEEAAAELSALAARRPDCAEAHHQLGNVLKSLRRYPEAAASLRRAVGLAPNDAAVWLNLGVASLELRRRDEAVTCFRRAIRLEPGRPEAHNILGHALLTQGAARRRNVPWSRRCGCDRAIRPRMTISGGCSRRREGG